MTAACQRPGFMSTDTGLAITLQARDDDKATEPCSRPEAAGDRLRRTVMDLSWTSRPPTADPALRVPARAWDQISLLPARPRGGSNCQMEGFQAEDRHNPLPHIGPYTAAVK
jgi:hypothetical protein